MYRPSLKFRHTPSVAMLIFKGATVHIVSQLIYQSATRFDVPKDRLAQGHPHVVYARRTGFCGVRPQARQ